MDALMTLIDSIKSAQAAGTDEAALNAARTEQRRATFLLDFVEAENSTGFHADQEAARILFLALDHLRQGQMALAGKTSDTSTPAPPETAPAAPAPPAQNPTGSEPAAVPATGQS